MFYYSGILYPSFMTNTLISVLQVYWVVLVWSSSFTSINRYLKTLFLGCFAITIFTVKIREVQEFRKLKKVLKAIDQNSHSNIYFSMQVVCKFSYKELEHRSFFCICFQNFSSFIWTTCSDMTQLINYAITKHFFVLFWLRTNETEKWPFYNKVSIRNSNVPKFNVIKKRSYIKETKNVIIKNTVQSRTKTKWNCNVMQTFYKKRNPDVIKNR